MIVKEVTPVVKEPLLYPAGTRRDNGDIGLLVDCRHDQQFVGHVVIIILYNAEAIYPQVFQAQLATQLDSIFDCWWESYKWDSYCVLCKICFGGLNNLLSAPYITQASPCSFVYRILRRIFTRIDDLYSVWVIRNFNQPRGNKARNSFRKVSFSSKLAFTVVPFARVEKLSSPSEGCRAIHIRYV